MLQARMLTAESAFLQTCITFGFFAFSVAIAGAVVRERAQAVARMILFKLFTPKLKPRITGAKSYRVRMLPDMLFILSNAVFHFLLCFRTANVDTLTQVCQSAKTTIVALYFPELMK